MFWKELNDLIRFPFYPFGNWIVISPKHIYVLDWKSIAFVWIQSIQIRLFPKDVNNQNRMIINLVLIYYDILFQNSCKITKQIDYKSIDIHNFCLVYFQMIEQIEEGFYLKIFVWYNKLKRTDEAKEISPNGTCDEMSFFTNRKRWKTNMFYFVFWGTSLRYKKKIGWGTSKMNDNATYLSKQLDCIML